MTTKRPFDIQRLLRTTEDIVSRAELEKKLASKPRLRVKYGVDVTASFLHIGHAVNLWMMRALQEAGHCVVFLIGDMTTRIGDPTGKSAARKVPTREEMEVNARAFIEQVSSVLLTDPEVFEIRRNSEWFDTMGVDKFLGLLSMVTHARLIQREMFQKRIANNTEIFMHEMLYPILQGYDSFMLDSDLTIVGSDQLFNEMMGRFYQERLGQDPQVVITTKITPGTDGKEKQSKSLGNYIALADSPRDKFGKVMSIPDPLIAMYFDVYTEVPQADVREMERAMQHGTLNPGLAKKRLAESIVARYHGEAAGQAEREWFDSTFSKKETPTDVPVANVPREATALDLIAACVPAMSRSDIRRLIRQGAVHLAGARLDEASETKVLRVEPEMILQVGKKKWFKLMPGA